MRLEEYWGVGPKTSELLAESLGTDRAVDAIESGDVRALTRAGLARGRATRILRRATGAAAMDVLGTRDTREVYKEILDLAEGYAVDEGAADRIRVLTPLPDRAAMAERVDAVLAARDAWRDLDRETRERVLAAFDGGETDEDGSPSDATDGDGDLAAVQTARALRETGVDAGVFAAVAELDPDALADAERALAGLAGPDNRIGEGADDRLDALRERLGRVEDMAAASASLAEELQSGARGADDFRDTVVRHVVDEAGVERERVRAAAPGGAADATDFVTGTLRTLSDDLRTAVEEREAEVARRLEGLLEEAADTVEAAADAVGDVGLYLSLARFAEAHDLRAPTYVDGDALAVRDARNLSLVAAGVDVQPVTYAVGDHDLEEIPTGDRVAVLTGANSGGKTTLLETLCQVQLLAQMGLPVPAAEARVGVVDSVVFHRRHASFNAGVLESTLRSVVPPVSDEGRTLMLVDEFEAITEPGRAADLLNGLVELTVDHDALGVFVTHLAEDLAPLPGAARTDGIFAEGLDPDLELEVDYQPRFGTIGRSTPEFIVSRLVANADDPVERAGFETLAEAVGEEIVQRTLSDVRWAEN